MKIRKRVLILVFSIGLICCTSTIAQDPPPPGIPAPQKEEVDHTAANDKLAKEIQKAIDALNELKDAAKIKMLKKIKKHIEDNKKKEPSKNIDDAIKKAVKKGEGTPQWLEDLVKGWKKTLGIPVENPNKGWKAQEQTTPIQPIQQSWSYRPIYFTEGTRQVNTSYSLITYTFPPHALDVLLNVRIVSADGSKNWLLQNVPVPASSERMSYRIRTDMKPYMQNDKWPEEIKLEYFIGPIRYAPGFTTQGQVTLIAQPELEDIGGSSIGIHPLFPVMYQPPSFTIPLDTDTRQRIIRSMQLLDAHLRDSLNVSLPPFNTYRVDSLLRTTRPLDIVMFSGIVQGAMPFDVSMDFLLLILLPIDFVIRGDAVPNIDLDSSKDPTDLNACVPAAAANSLTWLDEQHEEIDLPGNTRETLDELKKLMAHLKESGTEWDSMVKGKLDFINKNNLPINVKYQANAMAPAELKSNDPENPETAKNKSRPNPDKPGQHYHPDFEWLIQELKDGEDVELIWGNYCDTIVKDTTWYEIVSPGGQNIKVIEKITDRAKKTRRGGHAVNVTGAATVGPFKYITYKHDAKQREPGGTKGFDDDEDATDVSQWVTDEKGYANFPNRNYKDEKDDVNCTVYVEAVISESYVPPPTEEKDTPKDDDPEDSFEDDSREEELADPWEKITLTGGRMKPGYPFVISAGKSFPWFPVIAGVTGAGVATYFLTKDDKLECNFSATSQIIEASCGLANGTVSIAVAPEDQYEYIWSNGPVSNSLQNISAGSYTVTITRTGTECNVVLPVTVPNTNPTFNATITTQDAACGLQNGSAIVIVNPEGIYTYSWSTSASGQTQNNLAPGNYSVTVSAGGSCTEEYSLNIGELPPTFELTVTTTPSDCGQSNGTGAININPPGNYIVEWSPGITGQQVTDLPAGAYTITVTQDGTQCTKTITANVEELPPAFEVTVTTTPSDCGQSNGTGTININPPGNYIVEWSPGITGQQVTDLPAGAYTITVTLDGTQCSKTIMTDVGELPPTFEITVTTTPSDCGQSNGTGATTINPPGNYIVEWSPGITGQQVTDLPAGAYTITVTLEGTQCSKTIMANVDELPPAFTITSSTTPSGCNDSTGTANVTVDPPGAYTITWSNGLTGSQVSGLAAGDYQVTVTITGTTCSNTATVVVGQSGVKFTGTISVESASCGIADGSATITIDPAGEYTYVWSGQQTGPVAQQLSAGNYSVTVTDMNGCSSSFSATVGEDPAEYISIDNIMAGNCTGGGEINFTLATPGMGPLVLEVVGPGGTGSFTLAAGSYSLSAFGNLPAGDYVLTVIDQIIGAICSEVVNVTIPDNTPPLLATDDFYITPGGQDLIANALVNDSGLIPEMTMVFNLFGGIVVFNSLGEFTFTPDPGFSGEATFNYTVTDACGNTATALVTITVGEIICDFNLDITTVPASCGFDDGSIAVDVIEPGTYSFMWNTGDTDPVIANIPAGTYTVTVEDINLGCSLVFSIDLSENPADYIDDIVVTQPDCGTEGEISFVATTPSMNPLIMSVDHPNGSDLFFIEEGPVFLSDYISITPGQYTIEVTDPGASPDCVESFTVEINPPPAMIEIAVEAVFPPSEPTAMDGEIIIVVTVAGEVPYTVYLNGNPVSMTSENTITISGLGAGSYTIQIIDAQGCESNIVEAVVPLPDFIFSFGSGIHSGPYMTDPEHTTTSPLWSSGIYTSLRYYIGNRSQELRFFYAIPGDRNSGHDMPSDIFIVDHFSEITNIEWKKIQLTLQGGIGITFRSNNQTDFAIDPQHWIIRGNASHKLGKILQLQYSASLQGWRKIERPGVEVRMRFLNVFLSTKRIK